MLMGSCDFEWERTCIVAAGWEYALSFIDVSRIESTTRGKTSFFILIRKELIKDKSFLFRPGTKGIDMQKR